MVLYNDWGLPERGLKHLDHVNVVEVCTPMGDTRHRCLHTCDPFQCCLGLYVWHISADKLKSDKKILFDVLLNTNIVANVLTVVC